MATASKEGSGPMQDLSEVMGVLRLEDSQQLREFLGNLRAREERLAEELRRAQQEAADATAAKRQAEEKLALQSFQPPAAAQSAPANRA
jgi:cell division protein ZapA (FtsZ GTPase activity inhibitor)